MKAIIFIIIIILAYAEFNTDYKPIRVLPECEIWPRFDTDCHYPKYKVMEMRSDETN